jgi:hypothetical protein
MTLAKTALVFSALAVLVTGPLGCKPDPDPSPPNTPKPTPTTPPPLVTAPCKKTWVTDGFSDEGIDTRTGCMVVAMTLGSVAGAVDLSLPVALVRNEGIAPPATLYPKAWFGLGTWLSVDEYVSDDSTSKADIKFTLHTPNGDVVYDAQVKAPYAEFDQSDLGDDSKVELRTWFRARPFDGTLLRRTATGYIIRAGNPGDTRALTKEYEEPLPGQDPKKSFDRLLSTYTKASIYRGKPNSIDIKRSYVDGDVSLTFASSLFEGSGLTPLVIKAGQPRSDGAAGSMIAATTTLLHGWSSTVSAFAKENGNIESVVSSGRKTGETHTTAFTYANEGTPDSTVFASILEQEGGAGAGRVLKSLELKERAAVSSPTWPFAVKTMVDHARFGADRTHIVSECPSEMGSNPTPPRATYLRFNYAEGTTLATTYAEDQYKNLPVLSLDGQGNKTEMIYNRPEGGGVPGKLVPETGLELKWVYVLSNMVGGDQAIQYRFDKFSIDTYHIPLVGKVAIMAGLKDRQVLYRAHYGLVADPLNGNRRVMTFDAPRMSAGPDGRVRTEFRGLDGFIYETVDESGAVTKYTWLDQDKNGSTYDKETIDVSLMGAPQQRLVKDRFGRLLQQVDFDPALPMNQQPATLYQLTKDGYVDKITDTGTGEVLDIKGWNPPRSAMTSASLTRNGMTVRSLQAAVDDFGANDGVGTVTLGPIKYSTSTTRGLAGVLTAVSVTGSNGRVLSTALDYADGDVAPNRRTINGQPVEAATGEPLVAKGGCP